MTDSHMPAQARQASARPELFQRPADARAGSAADPAHINVLDALASELPDHRQRNWQSQGALLLALLSLVLIAILSVLVWRDNPPSTDMTKAPHADTTPAAVPPVAAAQSAAQLSDDSLAGAGLPARVENTPEASPVNPLSSLSESPAVTVPIGNTAFQAPAARSAAKKHQASSSHGKTGKPAKAGKAASKAEPAQAGAKDKKRNPLATLNAAPAGKHSAATDTDVMIIEALMTTPAAKTPGKASATPANASRKATGDTRAETPGTAQHTSEQPSALQVARSKLSDSANEKANELVKEKASEAGDKLLNTLKLTP